MPDSPTGREQKSKEMKIAIPQLNYRVGDIYGNRDLIVDAIEAAKQWDADLVVFPELAVCGAYPRDLLEREHFVNECREVVERLTVPCQKVSALIGSPNFDVEEGVLYNSMFLLEKQKVKCGVSKSVLSDYDVLDESRYFMAADRNEAMPTHHMNVRVLFDEYESIYIQETDDIVIHVGATPFTPESEAYRRQVFSDMARRHEKPIISLNHVGANGSVIFDGNTMVFNAKGEQTHQLAAFDEEFIMIDTKLLEAMEPREEGEDIARVHDALILGIRDFFRKSGFKKAVLGLSGGIDSAVVAALAAEALGKENVLGVLMPSQFSSDHSVTDAEALADNLGIARETLPIQDVYEAFLATLRPVFGNRLFSTAEENLQARARGMLVMAISNKMGHVVLNTSNKSEAAVGYGTLYGDMCGSLSVLGDVYKTDVYRLARYINRHQEIIPENTITKAPSAELRPGQRDQDSLPDYPTLDAILRLYIEEEDAAQDIVEQGFAADVVEKVIRLVNRSEYKHLQCPPALKVSRKAFGEGRRMPIAAKI